MGHMIDGRCSRDNKITIPILTEHSTVPTFSNNIRAHPHGTRSGQIWFWHVARALPPATGCSGRLIRSLNIDVIM